MPREYKRKSVEPYLCLFSFLRFRKDPVNKNTQLTPTPNMKCHQTEQSTAGRSAGGIYISQGRLLLSCLGLTKFSGFQETKTSANKRFYNYINLPRKNPCETLFAGHTPSSVGIECKGSEKFAIVQIFQLKV